MLLKNELATFRLHGRYTTTQCVKLHPPRIMQPSYRCIALMKSYEKLSLLPYDDQTGKIITEYCQGATIGYGHLIENSNEFKKYINGIDIATANSLFNADLYQFIQVVKNKVIVDLTQNEFDALVILAFNTGVRGFSQSTVLSIINGRYTHDLRSAWYAFRYSQGHVMEGLINRRTSEMKVFFHGVYIKI
ncbi:lysozyme [Citrobacter amalonaticus]|uniref:lysozyme n=1 Tax=Citrobacter amalonaticus TaxID=35703 RepID=UPI00300D8E66